MLYGIKCMHSDQAGKKYGNSRTEIWTELYPSDRISIVHLLRRHKTSKNISVT
jgi:hypothetical protein